MRHRPEKNGELVTEPEWRNGEPHHYHLLCVDDEETLVLLTAQALATKGYHVTALSNPIDAIELLHRKHIELAVLDYQMPEMNGARLAARIKRTRSTIKVVLFTGAFQIPETDLAAVDAVVEKSSGMEVLLATVDQLLKAS
jgi:CheY-like chemotaxis protein